MFDKPDLIARSIHDLRQKAKRQWLGRREKAVEYYHGDVLDYTQSYFGEDMYSKIPFSNNNITKRIIDRISLVYSEPTIRDVDNKTYSELTREKSSDLLHAERMVNLLNLILLKVSWRDDVFRYDTIRDFEIEIVGNTITKVSFPLSTPTAMDSRTNVIYEQWSPETIITHDENRKVISEEVNELGILPFIAVKTTEGRLSFTDIECASDLYSTNEAINVATANLNANIHFQSFGMAYVVGAPADEDGTAPSIGMGPDKLTVIPGTSSEVSVGILSPPDTVSSVKDGIVAQYRMVAQNYHLSSAFVEGNTQAESGVALRTRNQELNSFRKESIVLWRNAENKLYNIERQFLSIFQGITLPEAFNVDFGEGEIILSQSEQESQNNWDLEHGLITAAQILQRRDPDRFDTLDEYQKFIDDNKVVNTGVVEESISLNSILQG